MRPLTGSGLRVGGVRRTANSRTANARTAKARTANEAGADARLPRKPSRAVIPKAACAAECQLLEQLPNIGVSIAADLRLIGIQHPRELIAAEPMALYQALSATTGKRQDPCVLDTFMAAVDFMQGAAPAPWWQYTVRRKALYGQIDAAQTFLPAVIGPVIEPVTEPTCEPASESVSEPVSEPAADSDAQQTGAKVLCAHG